MRVSHRWGGFKALRARWSDPLSAASRRPVILIDEAQEMTLAVLCERRLPASANFDSQFLLCVVLSGDARLLDKLRREELIPLGSRSARASRPVSPPAMNSWPASTLCAPLPAMPAS